jgi:protein ImuB
VFDQSLELPAIAGSAPELMAAAWRLLGQLQLWLRARQQGVLAFGLEWRLDLRRLDGVLLPPTGELVLRTAEPVQAMDHLGRLLREQLARTTLAAPSRSLRLYSLETRPWGGTARTLLPEEVREGERLHQLVERLSARLGPARVLRPHLQADWRPEAMQRWEPGPGLAAEPGARLTTRSKPASSSAVGAGAFSPPWLVEPPLPLSIVYLMPSLPLMLLFSLPTTVPAGAFLETVNGPAAVIGGWAVLKFQVVVSAIPAKSLPDTSSIAPDEMFT